MSCVGGGSYTTLAKEKKNDGQMQEEMLQLILGDSVYCHNTTRLNISDNTLTNTS